MKYSLAYVPVAAADVYVSPETNIKGEVLREWLEAFHELLVPLEGNYPGAPPPGVGVL